MLGSQGQLGIGPLGDSKKCVSTPTPIDFFDSYNIVDICAGESHTIALGESGTVFVFGSNQYGQVHAFPFQKKKLIVNQC